MSDDYDVGYGKPPNASRFKPGQSGNPKGRPRGTKNLKTDLTEELNETIRITVSGRPQTISKQRALLKSLTVKALKGDARAADTLLRLWDRLLRDSEPTQAGAPLSADDQAILDSYLASRQSRPDASQDLGKSERPRSWEDLEDGNEHD
jgi:hypothetical protein